jgi:hypothetical protein
MNFGIPSAFAYADTIWQIGAMMVAFLAGYLVGGICR